MSKIKQKYLDFEIYTQDEMTVISGDIIAQIPTDFYTTGEVDSISGALNSKFSSYLTTAQFTTSSGDILSSVSTNYVDNTEMTTISGDLNTKITAKIASVSADTNPALGGNLNTGAYTVSGTGVIVTGDHGTATLPQVVNVVYGTGAAPTISGTNITEGTLYIKYTA